MATDIVRFDLTYEGLKFPDVLDDFNEIFRFDLTYEGLKSGTGFVSGFGTYSF